MPFPYSTANQQLFPTGQWTQDDDPNTTNLPFSLSPSLASPPPQAPAADFGISPADYNPVLLAGLLRGSAMQSAAGAARLGQSVPTIPPVSTPGTLEWWWDQTKRGHQGLADFTKNLLEGIFSPGFGNNPDHRRCIAASTSEDAWEEFCRSLERGENNVVGGGSSNAACWSKTLESPQVKRNWCHQQFGD